jgi:hypothetical protein
MASGIMIKFPISSIQYENEYILALEMEWNNELEASLRNDTAFVESGSDETCLVFNGTLNGDTVIKTDSRESIYTPLISSKLKFNIVSHNFPTWLIEHTNYYTDVRCVLALKDSKGNWVEQWRGYVWGNTLNSMVVDDWISTPLFAVDEIGMAKYLKPYNTIGEYGKSRRLWNYFTFYKTFNDEQFGHIYEFLGLGSSSEIYLDCPYCLHDYANNEIVYLLTNCWFDSYGYVFQNDDEDKGTWADLFTDICQYLGVTLMVGGHGANNHDSYLIETMDNSTQFEDYSRSIYSDDNISDLMTTNEGRWTVINPTEKLNANLNLTIEPMKYKGAKIKSEIKRYEAHEYLKDDNLDYYDKNKYVLRRWGTKGNTATTIATYCTIDPEFRKIYYMQPSSTEAQYLSTTTTNITASNNPNAYKLLETNYLIADLDAQTAHYPINPDKLDFIYTKMGATIIKFGEFDQREATEDESLGNYLLMMNHKWTNDYWNVDSLAELDHTASYALTGNSIAAASFKPFGGHEIRHNNEEHYLKVDYTMKVLDENKGSYIDRLTDASPYHVTSMRGGDELAMPSSSSIYEYGDESQPYGSLVGSYYDGEPIDGYPPMIAAEAECGEYHFERGMYWMTSGTNPQFSMMNFPENMDKCVYAISASTDSFGYRFCPYYNDLHPKTEGGKRDFLIQMYQNGSQNSPLEGVLTYTMKAPAVCFDWKPSGKIGYLNNIFYLISDIEFKITDKAEIEGKPTEYETQGVFDANSKTKDLYEETFKLSTPQYDGLFYNCFQYTPDGKLIRNARDWYKQGESAPETMERFAVARMMNYVAPSPMEIDITIRFNAQRDYNILWNNQLLIDDLEETADKFEVREKTIYINRDYVKFNANRVYTNALTERGFNI